jgi:hypothetical protein
VKVSIPAPLATLLWAALAALVTGYTVDAYIKTAENLPDAPDESLNNAFADTFNTAADTPPGQIPPLTPVDPSLLPKPPSALSNAISGVRNTLSNTPKGQIPKLTPVDSSLLPKLP